MPPAYAAEPTAGVPALVAPASAEPAPVPVGASPIETPTPGVRLGFADGTEVSLAVGDPRALALRAVADILVRGK
jgi:hypothetical protein